MTDKGKKKPARSASSRSKRQPQLRDGGTRLRLFNSGLEVWLYDDANAAAIRDSGAMDFRGSGGGESFGDLTKRGLIVGYGLRQDDGLDVVVYVGEPLSAEELSASRWLEPQVAFLRAPSGTVCVEPNDSLRVGVEEPTDEGGTVTVPPADYRVTLYRVDYEALFRERREWEGPQEVIVLTPGGSPDDAVGDLLPFVPRRDMDWVGKYEITGNRATGLAWFGDYWDTCIVNIDSAAAKRLSLTPGSYVRVHVPDAGITLVTVFGESWTDARKLPAPTGVPLDEYGYAAISPTAEWNGAEALFCRRETAKTRVEDEYHDIWIPATVEVLDPKEHPPAQPKPTVAGLTPTDLSSKVYFDAGFLSIILSDVLSDVEDLDEFPLADALDRLDDELSEKGLAEMGDVQWTEESLHGTTERSCRLYAGRLDGFVAILASEGCFDLLLVTELEDGRWLVTGLADDFESRLRAARHRGVANEKIVVESVDEPLKKIFTTHANALRGAKAKPVESPEDLEQSAAALQRFLGLAFG